MAALIEDTLSVRDDFELQHDRLVREEIETFRRKANAFLAGEIPEDEFRPFRLKHGIYGQRQPGVQMVRCKIPGGLLTSRQVEQFARIADEFGGGRGHLTTRQNIQYHFVPLARVAGLMHLLADVGLTNREACYNTVRNVTVCPLAGIARDEVFDVRPYAQKVAYAFLRKDLTGNLPRKFKIAFDGCAGQDSIASAINDIGLRAVLREGRRGFHVVIGGGLGPLPTEAQLLDEFVPEERLLNRCEAVIRVFNQYGNRANKDKARMKFVLRERGIQWLKEHIEKEYADILANGGIAWPERVPEGFGGYQSEPQPLGDGALLPVLDAGEVALVHADSHRGVARLLLLFHVGLEPRVVFRVARTARVQHRQQRAVAQRLRFRLVSAEAFRHPFRPRDAAVGEDVRVLFLDVLLEPLNRSEEHTSELQSLRHL